MMATTALMALPGLVAALEVPYELELTDQSPLFTYTPGIDRFKVRDPSVLFDQAVNWAVVYSESGQASWTPGSAGVGTSAHSTTRASSQASLNFVGTGVEVYGTSDGNYRATIDSQDAGGSENTLISISGLALGGHNAILRNTGVGPISITRAKVTTSMFSESA
jgi:hypothetical protein